MIKGLHAMFYSSEAEALRAFIRDKLGWKGSDVGDGWLIFDAPEADLGIHPNQGFDVASGTAELSFYCDDIQATMAELRGRGVEFTHEVEDHGYGWVTHFLVPGGFQVQLYQPRYSKQGGGPGSDTGA
jgi:predicted enzyme related to lactoylglutathione lyase